MAGLTRWTRTVSPCFTRRAGPGTVPLNVQTATWYPLATVISFSSIVRVTSWVVPSSSFGAVGS